MAKTYKNPAFLAELFVKYQIRLTPADRERLPEPARLRLEVSPTVGRFNELNPHSFVSLFLLSDCPSRTLLLHPFNTLA